MIATIIFININIIIITPEFSIFDFVIKILFAIFINLVNLNINIKIIDMNFELNLIFDINNNNYKRNNALRIIKKKIIN